MRLGPRAGAGSFGGRVPSPDDVAVSRCCGVAGLRCHGVAMNRLSSLQQRPPPPRIPDRIGTPRLEINTPRHEMIDSSDRRSEAVEVYSLRAVEVGFEHVGEVAVATGVSARSGLVRSFGRSVVRSGRFRVSWIARKVFGTETWERGLTT